MEDKNWEQRLQALTHIITSPAPSPPPLHSQYFIAAQVPCYLNWHYPPLLCPKPLIHPKWALSFFLRNLSAGSERPENSWRSKCPYSVPPPVVLAGGVEAAAWGDEERMTEQGRRRVRRKGLVSNVHPLVPFVIPHLLFLPFLHWKHFLDK
ncbi:hypothetical protein DM860_003532 [Cuscuta australis]|uniref:Uncharacterized protein n=1 Tax=Cuscuta australis TaxID=267555 RepID=A0A328DL77_9ASTE|nr:hypothetical protein DM860_003532 [Cuscuta australis]